MDTKSFEHLWMRRTKILTQAVIISVTLNIGLLATFVYFVLKDKQTAISFDLKPPQKNLTESVVTNETTLRAFSTLSFQELLFKLDDKELVEEGYTKRDLALSMLVAFHHFNLERALGGLNLQQRQIAFSNADGLEKIDLTIYPGLADYQYQAIIQYAKTEKWPLTSQGLFYEIKRTQAPRDPTLLEAFYLTPEYHSVMTLFSKSGMIISKEVVTELLSQGDWKILQEFTQQQNQVQDLSPTRRRTFLLNYLNAKSRIAARIFVEADTEFALKRLDDTQVLTLLDIPEKTPQLEGFAKDLLLSPRSDAVLKKTAAKLYSFYNEPFPEPYEHLTVLKRFVPESVAPQPAIQHVSQPQEAATIVKAKDIIKPKDATQPKPIAAKSKKMHVVKEGDNLWKIAKAYKVSVEAIVKENKLESERLRVGKKLDIPENKTADSSLKCTDN